MALKIRLRRQGRKNRAFYRLVVADAKSPRDGKYVESLGWYNPIEADETKKSEIKVDRVQHWLSVGAELTDKAESLIRRRAPQLIQEQTARKLSLLAKVASSRKGESQAS
jgi:small subunit ribosomal protein S16